MLALEPKPVTRTPPAQRWRNHYRVYQVLQLGRVGHWFPGIHTGPDDFPSQDLAETSARIFVSLINPRGRCFVDYAGAFREDVAAN
jgi:hypothetical protein